MCLNFGFNFLGLIFTLNLRLMLFDLIFFEFKFWVIIKNETEPKQVCVNGHKLQWQTLVNITSKKQTLREFAKNQALC